MFLVGVMIDNRMKAFLQNGIPDRGGERPRLQIAKSSNQLPGGAAPGVGYAEAGTKPDQERQSAEFHLTGEPVAKSALSITPKDIIPMVRLQAGQSGGNIRGVVSTTTVC